MQVPQPQHEYTIILIPSPASVAGSRGDDDQRSEEVSPREQLNRESRPASGNPFEPDLHRAELSTDR